MKSFVKNLLRFGLIVPLFSISSIGVLDAQEGRREQDKAVPPASRSANERPGENNQRDGGRNTNPVRESERTRRPDNGRPAEQRPSGEPDAKERLLKSLNLSKDERAKLESIFKEREEKMRDIQQSTMKAIKDAIGEEKFQTFMKNSNFPGRGQGPANPPREGDRGARPEAGRPEGERKAGPANPPREGDRGVRPEAGRPEGERKAGPANPPREGDRGVRPEAGRPEGQKRGPMISPETRERILNELNLSKDVRAKVEATIAANQEKIKDVFQRARDGNLDREKIMAEIQELQQNMMKNLREVMGAEKFQLFLKNAPMFNRETGPVGPRSGRGSSPDRDSSR
jgi:Skp family chaperone for outer membrane proteins